MHFPGVCKWRPDELCHLIIAGKKNINKAENINCIASSSYKNVSLFSPLNSINHCNSLSDIKRFVSQSVSHKGSKFLKKLWCYVGGRV